MSIRYLSLLAVAVGLGCAQSSGTSPAAMPMLRRQANHITAEEILAANADVLNAYEVVARLRPNWLASHGPSSLVRDGTETAMVFLDGQQYGDINSLRGFRGDDVGGLRFYNSSEAAARFGQRAGTSGVIEVRIKVRPTP
jgi:hypothetical protein